MLSLTVCAHVNGLLIRTDSQQEAGSITDKLEQVLQGVLYSKNMCVYLSFVYFPRYLSAQTNNLTIVLYVHLLTIVLCMVITACEMLVNHYSFK